MHIKFLLGSQKRMDHYGDIDDKIDWVMWVIKV
jgi:hypothetical protein